MEVEQEQGEQAEQPATTRSTVAGRSDVADR
jgi:hypothetical protein